MNATGGYRITEVARRSGIPATTLRYYEEIGLIPPPQRTDAGYRWYDDQALDRLRFIARAKQLGCSLEEIGELAAARDGVRESPGNDDMCRVVSEKIAYFEARLAEMADFVVDLRETAAALEDGAR